jgi:glutathione synthase/RimK-type ligase-like ATP-grasp enzyme
VIDGEVTHAVRKRPRAGEFRIQEQHGGRYAVEEVDDTVAELARWVVRASGADMMLARVDLVEDDAGVLQLAELEATEPDLYLELSAPGTTALAEAILARARPDGAAGANP